VVLAVLIGFLEVRERWKERHFEDEDSGSTELAEVLPAIVIRRLATTPNRSDDGGTTKDDLVAVPNVILL
jgi:hypothetical protein